MSISRRTRRWLPLSMTWLRLRKSFEPPELPILSGLVFFDVDIGWVHFRAPDDIVYELTQGPDLEPGDG